MTDRVRRSVLLLATLAVLTAAVPGSAQTKVTLSAIAPAVAQPAVHTVAITGSGFPTGSMQAGGVTISLRAASGGASITTTATSVLALPGTTRRVSFVVPGEISVSTPTAYQVSLSGRTTGGAAFASTNALALTLNPPAAIATVRPAAALVGAATDVTITTLYTDFVQGATQASFGPGVSVNGGPEGGFGTVTVTSATSATAHLVLAGTATAGPRALAVRTGVQQALLAQGFSVTATPPNQAPIANAGQGQTLTLPPGQATLAVTLDGSGSRDPDGTISRYVWSGTPDPSDVVAPTVALGVGTHQFTLTVVDNEDATSQPSQVTVTIVPARPPQVGVAALVYTVNQGATLVVPVNGTSPDGRGVSLSAGPALANATFAATAGAPASGTFTLTPGPDQAGIHLFTFQARDTLGLTDTKTVQVTINAVNHAPVVTIAPSASVDEGRTLVVPVTATDPDGDVLAVTATGLPAANAVFVPSAGSLTFTPDFTQAGTYTVTVKADDGRLSSTASIVIAVNDVPPPGSGALVLTVDPVESPSFLPMQRITGSVGAGGGTTTPASRQALITGMNPSTAEQGATLDVVLTGDASSYLPHFAAGSSAASFGDGVTVQSLTVTGPTRATARVTVAGTAAVGARPATVITDAETAISVVGFNVTRGHSVATGRVVDADTNLPLSGAVVSIEGLVLSALTDATGQFSLTGVPSGPRVLLVNAVNHELVQASFEARTAATVAVGTLATHSTVFNSAAPSAVSLASVLGRGMADTTGQMTEHEAKQLVTDSWLLVGGPDAGVLDDYGNQVNQAVTGQGKISLTPFGVRAIAEKVRRGDSMSLIELLYAFSFGYQWSTTPPGTGTPTYGNAPTLPEWLARLQVMVDRAWADPSNPDSLFAILLFNKGRTLSPVAPRLSYGTRLSALQANLFVMSFMVYALDPAGNTTSSPPAGPPLMPLQASVGLGVGGPSAMEPAVAERGDVVDPGGQGRKAVARNFWKNYFSDSTNFNYGMAATIAGASIGAATAICVFGGPIGPVIGMGILGVAVGVVTEIALQSMVTLNLMAMVPNPPSPIKAETVLNGDGKPTVRVSFFKSPNDSTTLSLVNAEKRVFYVYTLYRYDVSPYSLSSGQRAEDVKRTAVANFCSNCEGSYKDREPKGKSWLYFLTNPETIVDPNPTPNRTQYYDITVTRLVGETTLTNGDGNMGSGLSWWLNFLANVGQDVPKAGAGVMVTMASPFATLANGMKHLTSDFSPMVATYVGDVPSSSLDELEVDRNSGTVYFSDVSKRALFRIEWPGDTYVGTSQLTETAFVSPGQIGLAIDNDTTGNLYTDNHASDMQYGGRVFRFTPKSLPLTSDNYLPHYAADRSFIGSVNYFSQLLMFANPTSVSRMVYGGVVNRGSVTGRKGLTVVDEICGCVKELSLDDWVLSNPNRNVGQPIAYLPTYNSPVIDLAFDANDNLYILTNPDVFVLRPGADPGTVQPMATYVRLDAPAGRQVGGMAVDLSGNVYVSVTDPGDHGGKVLMYEKDHCAEPGYVPLLIMTGLDAVGDLELSRDGRALFMVAGDGVERHPFGFSGRIVDSDGNAVPGASVFIETQPAGYGRSLKTDADGRFVATDLFRSDLIIPTVRVSIDYDGKNQTFHTVLGQVDPADTGQMQYGQTVRTIVFATR